jgi:hypothetical protein
MTKRRWNGREHVENLKVDNFIADILSVYRKHNMSISHEDEHGAFVIQPISDINIEWLENAHDETEVPSA